MGLNHEERAGHDLLDHDESAASRLDGRKGPPGPPAPIGRKRTRARARKIGVAASRALEESARLASGEGEEEREEVSWAISPARRFARALTARRRRRADPARPQRHRTGTSPDRPGQRHSGSEAGDGPTPEAVPRALMGKDARRGARARRPGGTRWRGRAQRRRAGGAARARPRPQASAPAPAGIAARFRRANECLAPTAAAPAIGISAGVLLALLAPIALVLSLSVGTALAHASEPWGTAGLNEYEARVAAYLQSKGLDETHTAAVMGNLARETGGPTRGPKTMDPSTTQIPGMVGGGIGIMQWGYGADGGRGNEMERWARSRGSAWNDLGVQLDWMWAEMTNEGPAANQTSWYWGASNSGQMARFEGIESVEECTEYWERWMERAGVPAMDERIALAREYLTILTSGGGEEYESASPRQRAVADSARTTPTPGPGWCAKWVSQVLQGAGEPALHGNANDIFRTWCNSSDRSELKVGMVVGEDTSSYYGHVGIYVGDGVIASSESNYTAGTSEIVFRPVDEWIAIFGADGPVRWGWANGIDLSKE